MVKKCVSAVNLMPHNSS